MNKKRLVAMWLVLGFFMVISSGCALLAPAISAGIGYAIYQATN